MSERKRFLDVKQEDSDSDPAAKRSFNAEKSLKQEPVDYSNDYSPRSLSPIRSPSNAQFSPCTESPSSSPEPVEPVVKTEKIEKSSVEVPEKFLERVRERVDMLQKETFCTINVSPRITGLTRTVFLEGLREDIITTKDRIEEIVMSSIGFVHQVARKHLKRGEPDYISLAPSPEEQRKPIKKRVSINIPASKFQCYLIVGKYGATVKKLEMDTRCEISVYKDLENIEICGLEEDVERAKTLVNDIFAASAALRKATSKPQGENGSVIQELKIPSHLSNGYGFTMMTKKAKEICLKSDVKWQFQDIGEGKLMRLLVKREQVEKVIKEIKEFLKITDVSEDTMFIHSSKVAKIIGKNGETIKSLSKRSGAECHFNRFDQKGPLQTLVIKGSRQQISTARQMVQELLDTAVYHLAIPLNVYIGVAGYEDENIINISEVSGARCSPDSEDQKRKVIKIEGTEEQVELAKNLLECSIEIEEAKVFTIDTLKVSVWKASFVMGKNGSTLSSIRKESGSECIMKTEEDGWKVLEIRGTFKQVEHAKRLVREQIEEKQVVHRVDIPFHLYPAVVGNNNEKVTEISVASGAKCTCCPNEFEDKRVKFIKIEGTVEQVEKAISLLKDSIEMNEAKTTVSLLTVPISKYGIVIGKRYERLHSICNESGADCTLSVATETEQTFEIRGTTEQIARATGIIETIIEDRQQMSYTMFVPAKLVGKIIGINGVTMESIREESGAKVQYDPRRLQEPMKKFEISGTYKQIEAAKTLIQEASGIVLLGLPPNMDNTWNGYDTGMSMNNWRPLESTPPPPPPPPPLPMIRLTPPPPPPSPRRSLRPFPPPPPFNYPGPSRSYNYPQHPYQGSFQFYR